MTPKHITYALEQELHNLQKQAEKMKPFARTHYKQAIADIQEVIDKIKLI